MKDIHVYVYGSNVFATLLIEIGKDYSIFFKEENNSEDSSDIKDVIRIIFPEKLKLYEFKKGPFRYYTIFKQAHRNFWDFH